MSDHDDDSHKSSSAEEEDLHKEEASPPPVKKGAQTTLLSMVKKSKDTPSEAAKPTKVFWEPDFAKDYGRRELDTFVIDMIRINERLANTKLKKPLDDDEFDKKMDAMKLGKTYSKFFFVKDKKAYAVKKSSIEFAAWDPERDKIFNTVACEDATQLGEVVHLRAWSQKQEVTWKTLGLGWQRLILIKGHNIEGEKRSKLCCVLNSNKEDEEWQRMIEDGTVSEDDVCTDLIRLYEIPRIIVKNMMKDWKDGKPNPKYDKHKEESSSNRKWLIQPWTKEKISKLQALYDFPNDGGGFSPENLKGFTVLGTKNEIFKSVQVVKEKDADKEKDNNSVPPKPKRKRDDVDMSEQSSSDAYPRDVDLVMAVRTMARYMAPYMEEALRPAIAEAVKDAVGGGASQDPED